MSTLEIKELLEKFHELEIRVVKLEQLIKVAGVVVTLVQFGIQIAMFVTRNG